MARKSASAPAGGDPQKDIDRLVKELAAERAKIVELSKLLEKSAKKRKERVLPEPVTVKEFRFNRVRLEVETYYDVQNVRIKMGNGIEDYSRRGWINLNDGTKQFGKLAKPPDEPCKTYTIMVDEVPYPVKASEDGKSITFLVGPNTPTPIDIDKIVDFTPLVSGEEARGMRDWCDERMARMEKELTDRIEVQVHMHPLWGHWLGKIKGIGPVLAGGILSHLDPRKASTPSGFWKYCGLHIVRDADNERNGLAVKKVRGEKIDYNPFNKTLSWKIAESFLKVKGVGSYYGEKYTQYRAEYDAKPCPYEVRGIPHKTKEGKVIPCPPGHQFAMAKRKVAKLFLAHLWTMWRELEGLPTCLPYICEKAPETHTHIIEPPRGGDKG